MEKYCRGCQQNRKFILVSEDELEDTYKCEVCDLQSKKKTRTGWIATFAPGVVGGGVGGGFVGLALNLLSGGEHNDA